MNIKRVFGALLTVLGIGSLIYAAVLFINLYGSAHTTKEIIIYVALGLLFFVSGMGLIRTVQDN